MLCTQKPALYGLIYIQHTGCLCAQHWPLRPLQCNWPDRQQYSHFIYELVIVCVSTSASRVAQCIHHSMHHIHTQIQTHIDGLVRGEQAGQKSSNLISNNWISNSHFNFHLFAGGIFSRFAFTISYKTNAWRADRKSTPTVLWKSSAVKIYTLILINRSVVTLCIYIQWSSFVSVCVYSHSEHISCNYPRQEPNQQFFGPEG